MTRVVLSKAAEQDLIDIWQYIADHNIAAADRIIDDMEDAFELLSASSGIGHHRRDLTKKAVRFWPVHDYLVVYLEKPQLQIVRVLSGFRDIIRLLKETP